MKLPRFERSHTLQDLSLLKLIILATLVASVLTAFLHSGLFIELDLSLSDRLYQSEQAVEADIFILGIDETAIQNLGPYRTWTRAYIAEVIEILNSDPEQRPAVIGIDVLYSGIMDPEDDLRLANACAEAGNVVTAAFARIGPRVFEEESGVRYEKDSVLLVELPYPELFEATDIGHINTFLDVDGVNRRSFQYMDLPFDVAETVGTVHLPSFGLSVYQKFAEVWGLPEEPDVPEGARYSWLVPYSAGPGGFSDGFSIWDILSGDLPPEIFADSIVLIGPYAAALQDAYMTPIDPAVPMFGVEIHANIINAMISGIYRENVPFSLSIVITFCILFLLFIAYYFLHPLLSAFLLAAVSGGWLLLGRQFVFPAYESWFLFDNIRYQLPPLYVPLGSAILFIGMLAVHFLAAQRQKRQVTDMFKKYIDPAIIDDIFKTGIDNLQLGGKMTNICVMFIDIRGFTPMSELMSPPEVVSMLNDYLEMTSTAIFRHKGTLDKFIGDATMAFWGAPMPQEDIAYKAVLAAWDIVQSGLKMEAVLREKYGCTVSFGIGLNLGEAVVGNIGTERRLDYTAIGNTVNTAARLESNARPGQILISESVYFAVKERITARCVGNIPLKGKSEEIAVYALEHIHEYKEQFEPLASAKLTPGK